MNEALLNAMMAEFRASLPGIIAGNDPHSDILDTFDGYRNWLLGIPAPNMPTPTIQRIQAAVAGVAGVPIESMGAESQRQVHVRPRWAAMYIANKHYGYSLGQIGRRFHRDHTSVSYAVRQATKLMETDGELRELIDRSVNALGVRA